MVPYQKGKKHFFYLQQDWAMIFHQETFRIPQSLLLQYLAKSPPITVIHMYSWNFVALGKVLTHTGAEIIMSYRKRRQILKYCIKYLLKVLLKFEQRINWEGLLFYPSNAFVVLVRDKSTHYLH